MVRNKALLALCILVAVIALGVVLWVINMPTSQQVTTESTSKSTTKDDATMKIEVNGHELTVSLADNSSVDALISLLQQGPLTIDMRDYENMEKVGSLGTTLPRNDEQITTEPGDVILYQGGAIVIYYAPNSWNFTRLGKIDGVSQTELKEMLGSGNAQVTFSIGK